ncbi:MAG: TolC family outer membrane protein [Pseudomonadota bacterium]|nr:TolC family outer membrane protein [Pseudomonadota bacterium]MDO7710631.1 TolC family outer membrane protein [Pseudomonadota bacterium]
MKRLKLTTILIASLISTATMAEDLIQVYSLALKSDPQLLAEAASRLAVGELDNQARAQFLPQVGLSADTGYTWQDTSSTSIFTSGKRDYNNRGYTLSITQPIYRKQNFIQQAQADIAIEGATASYQIAEQALIVRVSERYFDVLGRQDDVTFAIAEREAIDRQLEQTQQRFDVGISTITDVVESQAAYDLANAAVISAENELANSGERLREIAGKYVDMLSALKADSPLVSPEPTNINEWSDVALTQNPSLLVSRSEVNTASQTIELQKSGHYPTLDLVGQKSYSYQGDSNFGGSSSTDQDSLSLQFNLPIDAAGGVRSRTREAVHRLDQSMQNEEQQRRAVMRQTREAYNGVMSGISRVIALKQAVVSNEKALESTKAGYEVGTRTTVDVLNVRRDLFRARRDYAQSRYDYIVNTLRLKQAAGTIGIDDLAIINGWLAS